jgi:hypothetical protein
VDVDEAGATTRRRHRSPRGHRSAGRRSRASLQRDHADSSTSRDRETSALPQGVSCPGTTTDAGETVTGHRTRQPICSASSTMIPSGPRT